MRRFVSARKGALAEWLGSTVKTTVIVLVLFVLIPVGGQAEEQPGSARWTLLGGYGITHTGLGKTKLWLETVDLVGRYERVLSSRLGASWYRGYHSLLVELPLHLVIQPSADPMIGLNFLAGWTFTHWPELRPYVFIGGGPLYTGGDIPGMGARINGNYQVGAGLRFPLANRRQLVLEYRFHHVSNGGLEDPNDPLNSSKLLLGITF